MISKKIKLATLTAIGVIIISSVLYAVILRDSANSEVVNENARAVLTDIIKNFDASKYASEFEEKWVFKKAKKIKIYADFDIAIDDNRIEVYRSDKEKSVNINSIETYRNNTLIVMIYKPNKDRSDYDDDIEISYAWGPLAAHGIGIKIKGNSIVGYTVHVKHRWIS